MNGRLLDERALSGASAEALAGHLRTHGMYPPSESCRQGAAAFTVRDDLSVHDVVQSVGDLLRQASSVVAVLACDRGADEHVSGTAEAVEHLLKQARGLHSLLHLALGNIDVQASSSPAQTTRKRRPE